MASSEGVQGASDESMERRTDIRMNEESCQVTAVGPSDDNGVKGLGKGDRAIAEMLSDFASLLAEEDAGDIQL